MRRLLDWERTAIVDAYAAHEKRDSICAEFNVCPSYPGNLARRRGVKPRSENGRPKIKSLQPKELVLVSQ